MTAGNQPESTNQINGQVTAMCLALRNDFQNVINFNAWLTAVGGATFLENMTSPFDSADAAVIVSTIGNLATLAGIWQGAAPGAAFNYETNAEVLFAGQ
jgi:hypothetical protein